MATKKAKPARAIVNRRASYDYTLDDELIVGIVLRGPEVRAARDGHVQLKGAYVTLRHNELWLTNASFSVKLNEAGKTGARSIETSPRKLLAHKKQLESLEKSKQVGMSIVPLRLLTQGKHIKLVIALGKGKKTYDKRETLKRRDQERESNRAIKQR